MAVPAPTGTAVRQRRAIDLEDLVVWAIRTQKADRDRVSLHAVELAAAAAIRWGHRPAGGFNAPASWGVDSCVRVAEIGLAGTRVDGGGQIRGVAPRMLPLIEDSAPLYDELRAYAVGRLADARETARSDR